MEGQYQEVTCGYYRPFSSYSTGFYNAIEYGQTLNFLTGFNIFTSAVDGAPDDRDFGGVISITLTELVEAAIHNVSAALSLMALVLIATVV